MKKFDKGPYIQEIEDGKTVHGIFLISDVSRAETKSGTPYLMLKVLDRTGEISGRIWEHADRWEPHCQSGSVVVLTGQAQLFRGDMQLKISRVDPVDPDTVDFSHFVPTTSGDIDEMARELTSFAQNIQDADLRNLLQGLLSAPGFMQNFKKAPAAKRMHHAYLGGLLEHTLSVTRLADAVAGLYPAIDRSLLLTGALIHDIGKIKEFSYDSYPFQYSDSGRLVGHMVLGIEMIQEIINTLPNYPADLAMRLKHLILSHHGQYDFGSPALPMMLESFILHFVDDLDAKVNTITQIGEKQQEPGYHWSDYQRHLERFLYLTTPDRNPAPTGTEPGLHPEETSPKSTADHDSRQQALPGTLNLFRNNP